MVNNADKGSTQVLEAQAEELWNKQDANDMNVTKEEFIADYVKSISDGMTPEQFEKLIPSEYSIKFAEEQAEKEKQEYLDQIWEENKDKLTCDKDTFIAEYEEFTKDLKPEEISEGEFIASITNEYGIPEETQAPSNNNNTGGSDSGNTGNTGNGGSSYTPPAQPAQTEPVYTPPAQTTPVTPVTPPSDNGGGSAGGGFSDNGSSGNTGSDANEDDTPDIPPGFVWDDDFADSMADAVVD